MRIGTAALLGTAELLTCGVTQVVGALALTCLAIKSIWDAIHFAYHSYRGNVESFQYLHNLKANGALSLVAIALMIPFLVPSALYLRKSYVGSKVLFPIAGDPFNNDIYNSRSMTKFKEFTERTAKEVTLKTADQRSLKILHYNFLRNRNDPTVILFNGNGGIKESNFKAKQYFNLGLNVITFTYGGYPGSPQNIPVSEETLTQDAFAVANYAIQTLGVPTRHLISHGTSLGAALALTVGKHVTDSHVVVEVPFSTPMEVVKNLVPKFLYPFAEDILDEVLPVGKTFETQILGKRVSLTTDRLNNVKKVKDITGSFFAIAASQDRLMMNSTVIPGRRVTVPATLPENLCQDIVDTYRESHPGHEKTELMQVVNDDHNPDFKPDERLTKFLKDLANEPADLPELI